MPPSPTLHGRRTSPCSVVSLAFAASAQAAPTKPGLNPIPYWVCGSSLPISWTASTPDPFGTIVGYRVDIGDLTAGTSSAKFTSALGTTSGAIDLTG